MRGCPLHSRRVALTLGPSPQYLASLPPDYVPSRAELAEHGFFPYAPLRPVVNYVGRGSLPDGEVEEPDEDEADGTAGAFDAPRRE